LRQFIQTGLAQQTSQVCQTIFVRQQNTSGASGVTHGAELTKHKRPFSETDPLLTEQNRASHRQTDRHCAKGHKRKHEQQQRHGQRQVYGAFERARKRARRGLFIIWIISHNSKRAGGRWYY
jgi:hypothetical protein